MIRPEIALGVALSKLDEATGRMEEALRFAHEFNGRMSALIAEVKALKREIEGRWRDYLRSSEIGTPT